MEALPRWSLRSIVEGMFTVRLLGGPDENVRKGSEKPFFRHE